MCRYPESSINPKHLFPQRYPKIKSSAHVKGLNCFLDLTTEFKLMKDFYETDAGLYSPDPGQLNKKTEAQTQVRALGVGQMNKNFWIHGEIKHENLLHAAMSEVLFPEKFKQRGNMSIVSVTLNDRAKYIVTLLACNSA